MHVNLLSKLIKYAKNVKIILVCESGSEKGLFLGVKKCNLATFYSDIIWSLSKNLIPTCTCTGSSTKLSR